ncbi:MAG: hypothetical protein R3E84_06225 [Pseudomonadales bacterium]
MTERRRALALAGASVLILAIALPRLQLGYDLGAFLPAARDDAQRVLVERLGQGPGAQLLFAVLPNVSHHDALAIAARLRARTEFTRVLPETFSPGIDAVPAAVWAHRLLLRDLPADIDGWQSVFGQRMDDIAFADDGMLRLITADPALASVEVLQTEAQDIADGELKTTDGSVIVAQTRSPAFDLSGQAAARAALEAELTGTPDARLLGSGVYGLQLQERIRHEATLYSVLASLVLLLLILWHFRSLAVTALVALPLVAGGAAGLLALTILFDVVHGITLAFGFTLLGVVIDYPLHVYTHRRGSGSHGASGLWATLWTGVLSTLIAYAAFAFSGTNGLAQLGVFGLVGVAGGALATRWLVPPRPAGAPEPEAVLRPAGLRHRYWLAGLALSLPVLLTRPVFDDNLASLSPLDADTLRDDARLRQSLGVADLRHLVAIRLDDAEAVLHGTEVVMRRLEQAGFNAISVSTLLPSRHTQQQRRAVLKSLVAGQVVERALAQTPFDMAQFQPFFTALDTEAASSDIITYDTVTADPALAGIVTGRFYPADGNWVSLIFLRGTGSTEAVGPLLHDVPGATFVDLAESASALVRVYRTRLLEELGLAIGLIVVLLVAAGRGRQLVWTLGTVTATVCLGAAFAVVVQNGLSLFSLVALTLVAGLGLDYALFYARPQSETAMQLTTRAVGLCAFSSLAVFGILSFSDVPVLRGIGLPVAAGVLAAYVLSRFGRHTTSGT